MLVGHAAVALLAKRAAPQASLGTLVAAALLLDGAWPLVVLLAGGPGAAGAPTADEAVGALERIHYPFTHGEPAAAFWAALAGILYFALRRRRRAALVVAALVASHWLLDRLDAGPPGAGPWLAGRLAVPGEAALEALLVAAGLALYGSVTRPRDRAGALGLAGLGGCLLLGLAAGVVDAWDGERSAAAALALWLLVPAAAWVDRHRVFARRPPEPAPAAA